MLDPLSLYKHPLGRQQDSLSPEWSPKESHCCFYIHVLALDFFQSLHGTSGFDHLLLLRSPLRDICRAWGWDRGDCFLLLFFMCVLMVKNRLCEETSGLIRGGDRPDVCANVPAAVSVFSLWFVCRDKKVSQVWSFELVCGKCVLTFWVKHRKQECLKQNNTENKIGW